MREDLEIARMIAQAVELREVWREASMVKGITRDEFATAIRNYNALRGVIKALKWSIGVNGISDPLS